jgi:hypothetical protein
MVVRDGNKTILIETGIGAFFDPKLRERYGVVEPHHVLLESLGKIGIRPDDVDVVVFSHLHFDHAGGALTEYAENVNPQLVFPRAVYVVGAEAWQRAVAPHARDKASFIPGLTNQLAGSGRIPHAHASIGVRAGGRDAGPYAQCVQQGHVIGRQRIDPQVGPLRLPRRWLRGFDKRDVKASLREREGGRKPDRAATDDRNVRLSAPPHPACDRQSSGTSPR